MQEEKEYAHRIKQDPSPALRLSLSCWDVFHSLAGSLVPSGSLNYLNGNFDGMKKLS